MTMTVREAFERGTDTFNAHDLDGFAEVLADDVVFEAPGGMRGEGKPACLAFYGSWFGAFPDAHLDVHRVHHRRRRRRRAYPTATDAGAAGSQSTAFVPRVSAPELFA